MLRRVSLCLIAALTFFPRITPHALAQTALQRASAEDREMARSLLKELIEINTTDTPRGNVTAATSAMEKRFLEAGFAQNDVQLLGPDPHKQNLVVRIRAAETPTAKPVLFLCHMDVVEALRSDWTTEPFELVEKDGFFYGRGTKDMKDGDAIMVATFLRLHRDGYKPKRDLILAITADEEGGKFNGAQWLVNEHRDLVDAAFVINLDAGGVQLEQGRPVVAAVGATEKVYSDFQITAVNRGGHSSLPRPDNAIYELTSALNKLAAFTFPFELNDVTRAYFGKLAEQETPPGSGGNSWDHGNSARHGSSCATECRAQLQCEPADYLRCDAAQCWPRQQCFATDSAGNCELPHLSGAFSGRDPAKADRGFRRQPADGEVRLRCGRGFGHGSEPKTDLAACADPRGIRTADAAGACDLDQSPSNRIDGKRSKRLNLFRPSWDSLLRILSYCNGTWRRPRPRTR